MKGNIENVEIFYMFLMSSLVGDYSFIPGQKVKVGCSYRTEREEY